MPTPGIVKVRPGQGRRNYRLAKNAELFRFLARCKRNFSRNLEPESRTRISNQEQLSHYFGQLLACLSSRQISLLKARRSPTKAGSMRPAVRLPAIMIFPLLSFRQARVRGNWAAHSQRLLFGSRTVFLPCRWILEINFLVLTAGLRLACAPTAARRSQS